MLLLLDAHNTTLKGTARWQAWTRAICSAAGVHESFYAFGHTKVFFKHPDVVTHLDNHLEYALAKGAVTIQSSWRALLCRRRLQNLKKSTVRRRSGIPPFKGVGSYLIVNMYSYVYARCMLRFLS